MKKINSIYIIDDDPITVFGIQKLLGYIEVCNSINTFSNGKLAIDNIKRILQENQQLPEIIFLDINMPIMNGWQFLEEFITLPLKNKIRVNIITSSINSVDKKNWELYNSKTYHNITYNSKPITRKDIAEITIIA